MKSRMTFVNGNQFSAQDAMGAYHATLLTPAELLPHDWLDDSTDAGDQTLIDERGNSCRVHSERYAGAPPPDAPALRRLSSRARPIPLRADIAEFTLEAPLAPW